MSLPIARSTESTAEQDASRREGRLADASVPELLARAYRVSFSGSLVLEPVDAAPSTLRFAGGAVIDAAGPWHTQEREWSVLAQLLPADTLEFATGHSTEYGVTPFAAVERLVLLPPESLASARQALTVLGVETSCGLSGDARYEFVGPAEPSESAEVPAPIEPLGLLASCFLVESQRERAARSVAAFEYSELSTDAERARRLLPTLNGPVRAVLEAVSLAPVSLQALRERNALPNAELVAAVCALWITRELGVRGHDAGAAVSSRGSERPSALPKQTIPPFVQAASNMPPPRKQSGFVRAQRGSPAEDAKERAMELKVEEALARAEIDPSRAHQISSIVHKALAVFPKNPRLHYTMARLHIQASRMDEAATELERALELDPGNEPSQQLLAELRARAEKR